MQKYYYYIIQNAVSSDKSLNLPYKYSIQKIPTDFPFQPNTQRFTSLRQLKRYSSIYRDFKLVNPRGARKICEDRFIATIKDAVITPSDNGFDKFSWDFLGHTIHGKFEKEFSGLHLICDLNKNIKNIIETKTPDRNGVWEAEITVYSETKKKSFTKISTLFPKVWTANDFMLEIYEAFKTRKKIEKTDFCYQSSTKSGVPVQMIIKNNKLLSTYPLYTEN
jgi:hypothetical protein